MIMAQKRRTVTFSQYGINMVAELSRENNMYYYMDMDSSLQCSTLAELRTCFKKRMEEFILKQVALTQSKYESLRMQQKGLRFSENDYLAALYSLSRKKVFMPELWSAIKSNYESRNKKERLDIIREKMAFKTIHKAGRKSGKEFRDGPEVTDRRRIPEDMNKAHALYPEGRKPINPSFLKRIVNDFTAANHLPADSMRMFDSGDNTYIEITGKDLYVLFPVVEIHNVVVNPQKSCPNLAFVFMTGSNLNVLYRKGRLSAPKRAL